MSKLDESVLSNLLNEYDKITSKKEKSDFYTRASLLFSVTPQVFKSRFLRFKKKRSTDWFKASRKDNFVSRLSDVKHEEFVDDVLAIAAVRVASSLNPRNEFRFFRNRKFNSTEIAIEIAFSQGKIKKRYSASTVNFWLRRLGVNYASFFRDLASIHLTSDHTNHVWYIDATPLQSIYIDRNARLIYDTQIAQDKNHGNDILIKRDLRKVWLYFVVDKYSGAFLIKIFAGEKLGENEYHWLETLRYAMMKKEDYRIPFAGVPQNIYADGGALKGKALAKHFEYFGILGVAHAPGNSRATGGVEARIGSFKKTIETLFNSAIKPSEVHNNKLESLIGFCQEWSIYQNLKMNLFGNYTLGLKAREEIIPENFVHAGCDIEYRVVDNFGQVGIDSKLLYVNIDLVQTRVAILRRFPNRYIAKDVFGALHECSEELNISELMKKKHVFEKSRFAELQKHVISQAADFKKTTSVEDLLPNKIFAIKNENIVAYSIQTSWEFLLQETSYTEAELPEDYKELFATLFHAALEKENHVSKEVMNQAIFLLKKYMNTKEENQ